MIAVPTSSTAADAPDRAHRETAPARPSGGSPATFTRVLSDAEDRAGRNGDPEHRGVDRRSAEPEAHARRARRHHDQASDQQASAQAAPAILAPIAGAPTPDTAHPRAAGAGATSDGADAASGPRIARGGKGVGEPASAPNGDSAGASAADPQPPAIASAAGAADRMRPDPSNPRPPGPAAVPASAPAGSATDPAALAAALPSDVGVMGSRSGDPDAPDGDTVASVPGGADGTDPSVAAGAAGSRGDASSAASVRSGTSDATATAKASAGDGLRRTGSLSSDPKPGAAGRTLRASASRGPGAAANAPASAHAATPAPAATGASGAVPAGLPPQVAASSVNAQVALPGPVLVATAAAAAPSLASSAGAGAPALPMATVEVAAPTVGQPGWAQVVAQAIAAHAVAAGGRLRLHLQPPNLGPVDIALDVHDARATVQIIAQHPLTQAALQQSIPQLHALLGQQGVQLMRADVMTGQSGGRSGGRDARPTPPRVDTPTVAALRPAAAPARARVGLIDDYA